jgi:hypothetical protein
MMGEASLEYIVASCLFQPLTFGNCLMGLMYSDQH